MSDQAVLTAEPELGAPPRASKLRRFLNCYWLRPENALWMTLRSDVLEPCQFGRPSIDLSCGDGIFSFLHAGGDFDLDFDVFTSVRFPDQACQSHADMFNHIDDRYCPMITARPNCRISVGTDWKRSLLDKAALLGLYDRLILQDNNCPLKLPDGGFATVYCNAIYWVRQIEMFLREIRRITKPEGHVLLQVKLANIFDYTLERFRKTLGERWLQIIGRGRFETWLSMGDDETWRQRFAAAGLTVEQAIPFVTRTHAHVWDIGLRPIAPMLVRLANSVSHETRREVKTEWIELLAELLEPFAHPDLDLFGKGDGPAEVLYVLRPA